MTVSDYKTCARCGQEFPRTTEFFSPCRNSFQSYCKPNGCEKAFFHEQYILRRDRAYADGTRKRKVTPTPEQLRERALAHYYANRDKIHEKQRQRYVDPERREKVLAAQRQYAIDHPERRAANRKKWSDANRVRRAGYSAARRALQAGARVEPRISYVAILREHGRHCHICGGPILLTEKLTFDHIIPLALGGPHSQGNLAPAHASCNFRKGARLTA